MKGWGANWKNRTILPIESMLGEKHDLLSGKNTTNTSLKRTLIFSEADLKNLYGDRHRQIIFVKWL